jgi:hypothetical protein
MPWLIAALAAGGFVAANGGVQKLGDVASVLEGFVGAVTDGTMWRSLGWLLLGIVLMFAGGAMWIKTAAL